MAGCMLRRIVDKLVKLKCQKELKTRNEAFRDNESVGERDTVADS